MRPLTKGKLQTLQPVMVRTVELPVLKWPEVDRPVEMKNALLQNSTTKRKAFYQVKILKEKTTLLQLGLEGLLVNLLLLVAIIYHLTKMRRSLPLEHYLEKILKLKMKLRADTNLVNKTLKTIKRKLPGHIKISSETLETLLRTLSHLTCRT